MHVCMYDCTYVCMYVCTHMYVQWQIQDLKEVSEMVRTAIFKITLIFISFVRPPGPVMTTKPKATFRFDIPDMKYALPKRTAIRL